MNEEEVFHQVLALSLPEERAAYLQRACAGDPALRASIEALLRANEGASGFMDRPAPGLGSDIDEPIREGPGTVVGPYKLLERIGEGGMGLVYMAEQMQPVRRKVALKLIKPGMDTRQVTARFEAERQALALMDHPYIARILDAGATESGRPYFVMELVRGMPITEYCDRNRLSIAERLDLFVLICQAVQHAHQQGIIHRDLKPSNVLITRHDGVPVPKVIDFGIAKATGQQSLTDKTLYTGFTQLIGTPMYLSPEQADLSGIDVDTRSDVYSLGVLHYELLTGTTPFDHDTLRRAALDEVRRIIREQEPPPPSTRLSSLTGKETTVSANRQADPRKLNHLLRGELDWITIKALEKDRRRRYDTAGAFAADIARYRGNRPVEAVPPSAWYRGGKFVRRHRLALAIAVLVAISAALVVGTWTWFSGRLDGADRAVEQSRNEVQRRAIEARHHRYAADIRQAHQLAQNGQGPKARELLRKYRPAAGQEDVREFAWYYLMRLCHGERRSFSGHEGAVYHAGFSPDGRTLVSCSQDGTIRLWDVATGRPVRTLRPPGQPEGVNWAEFSADGRTIVSAGDDGRVRLWDAATGGLRATIAAHAGQAYARFTPDGRRLISAGRKDGLVKLWDLATHEPLKAIKASTAVIENIVFPDQTAATWQVATGKRLATIGGVAGLGWAREHLPILIRPGGTLELVDAATGRTGPALDGAESGRLLACSRQRGIVALRHRGQLVIWDLAKNRVARRRRVGLPENKAGAFSPDGSILAVVADGAVIQLWDVDSLELRGSLPGHSDSIQNLSFSPDGRTIVSAGNDGTVKLWDVTAGDELVTLPESFQGAVGQVRFAPDGRSLAVMMLGEEGYRQHVLSTTLPAGVDFEEGP